MLCPPGQVLSAEHYVTTGKRAALPEGLPPELTEERAGVFVSLKKHGSLRGCIGTISPMTDSIAEEILRNAVSACAKIRVFACPAG
jgi:AMMECR1 domain-containing protein